MEWYGKKGEVPRVNEETMHTDHLNSLTSVIEIDQ